VDAVDRYELISRLDLGPSEGVQYKAMYDEGPLTFDLRSAEKMPQCEPRRHAVRAVGTEPSVRAWSSLLFWYDTW
jgi:hypothetical protein